MKNTKEKLESVLNSLKEVEQFLEENDCINSCTRWEDSDGDGFTTDLGYFEDGIYLLKGYLINKINKYEN